MRGLRSDSHAVQGGCRQDFSGNDARRKAAAPSPVFAGSLSTAELQLNQDAGRIWVTRYRNVTVASARLTLSDGQRVTGPGAAPGAAILVPWPGWLRVCAPAAFDTVTAPSIRNTPSA